MKKIINKLINKETVTYGIFGVVTTLVNVVLFRILLLCGLEYTLSNLISIICAKLTAYVCNKLWVFHSHTPNLKDFALEFLRFLIARGATALVDYFGLILLVEVVNISKMTSKITVTVLVIILNYVLGKNGVFKNKTSGK